MIARSPTEFAAVDLYGAELLRTATRPATAAPLHLVDEHGEELPLALARYLGRTAPEEDEVLRRAIGPVLDVGCGPGRHVLSLSRRGIVAVGVDISPLAVRLARRRGAFVLEGSIFDRLPGAGSWGSALLLDGNIGIGGAPGQLLARVRALLCPDGTALVEVEPPGERTRTLRVRLESAAAASEWFDWARLGVDDLAPIAARAGFVVAERWHSRGRWFATLLSQ